MLELQGKPTVQEEDERMLKKVVRLHGNHRVINEVAERRISAAGCNQLPHGHSLPPAYDVQIRYSMDYEGFVSIESVDVNFGVTVSTRWSCFFDRPTARMGHVTRAQNKFHFFFLKDAHADDLAAFLTRIEEHAAITRLAQMGPEAFPVSRGSLRDDPETLRHDIHVDVDEPEEPFPDQD